MQSYKKILKHNDNTEVFLMKFRIYVQIFRSSVKICDIFTKIHSFIMFL